MSRTLPSALAAFFLATGIFGGAAHASPTSELRVRRQALSRAMSRRDPAAVAAFHSPKFVSRGRDGTVVRYQEYFSQLSDGLQGLPGFRQSVVIERSQVRGSQGTLWVRTTDSFRETPRKVVRVRKHLRETWQRQGKRWLLMDARQFP